MKRDFSQAFNTLLDTTSSLGVGMVDVNGLLVHSAGAHGGLSSAEVAAQLIALRDPLRGLERTFDDEIGEQIVMGRRHTFYLLRFEASPYLIYAVTGKDSSGGRVRFALLQTRDCLAPRLTGQGLLLATSKRLEQPRQFQDPRFARKPF